MLILHCDTNKLLRLDPRLRRIAHVVSIATPGRAHPDLRNFKSSLAIEFEDLTPEHVTASEFILRDDDRSLLFSNAHAQRIWSFVCGLSQEDTLVVQSERNRRRAPAVCAAIVHAYEGNDRRYFTLYNPNRHVYETMLLNAPEEDIAATVGRTAPSIH